MDSEIDRMIDAQGLTRKYGDFTAVDGVSFSVKPGEIFAFLGPNGAGKTTTIKMLTTLLSPTAGTMALDGHDPAHDQAGARRTFGIVFQDPSLDDELTAEENMEMHAVMYGISRNERRTRIPEMLAFVELLDRKDELVKRFSGGMKRRLEIARGLLHKPKIMFLDEPTLGLDPQTRNRIWEYLRGLNSRDGVTVFFTTHYMLEAEQTAHRVAVIDHGRIIAQDTVSGIKALAGGAATLEEAFLRITGKAIRDEEGSATDSFRMHSRAWGRR